MIRTQVQLSEEQAQTLKQLSATSGLSMAELIRRGLEPLLREPGADRAAAYRRAAAAAGRFRSGRSDISTDHDRYLAEPEQPEQP